MSESKKKVVLGRGLGAILGDNESMKTRADQAPATSIHEILLSEIEVNPFQPRTEFESEALQELSESIKVQGIIQPITVRKLADKKYQIISGERRFRASKLAGLKQVPAYVRLADDQQMLEMALIENIQRENLNPMEVALSYQRLITECSLKQEELGDRVGKKRSTVTNYLRLLKLPPDIQSALRDSRLSMGHARALISIENPDQQLWLYKKIMEEELSVRAVEELARKFAKPESAAKTATTETRKNSGSEWTQLQTRLSSHFGSRIQVQADQVGKGEIRIPFVSVEDLNRILEIINL